MKLYNSKDINEIKEIFFDMEISEGLFDQKLDDGLYYWDIIRREVFYEIYRAHDKSFVYKRPKKIKTKWKSVFFHMTKNIISQVNILIIRLWKPNYIFITAQRLSIDSNNIDIICDPAFDLIANKKTTLGLETCNKLGVSLFGKKKRILNVINDFSSNENWFILSKKISSLVFNYFHINIELTSHIEQSMTTFRNQENHYRKIFSCYQPKAIIIVQNGIMKGLFSVAKELSIPVFEFQHGSITDVQIFYSYPKKICSSHKGLFLPHVFLTFSPFWGRGFHFPVKKIKSVGNDFFHLNPVASESNDILIISTRVHHQHLISLSKEVSSLYPEKIVIYKLHPSEFHMKNKFKKEFSNYKNIKIIGKESQLMSLFSECEFVIAIQSSAVFEAIQAGKEVLIYKRSNYKQDSVIFKYISLFDSITELHSLIESHKKDPKSHKFPPVFFEKFDPIAFKSALGIIEKNDAV